MLESVSRKQLLRSHEQCRRNILEISLSLDYLMKGEGETPQHTEEVQIPASLAEFAKKENISFVQALMLLDMQRQIVAHRRSPELDDLQTVNWRKFYESMKEFL